MATPKLTESENEMEEKALALEEVQKKEKELKREMKLGERLQSGARQGGAGGAGIGAGVAAGLGTVVGGLVGGVAGIPTTGLGLLIGAGTGAIHGPWAKEPDIGSVNKDPKANKIETEERDAPA